MDDGNIQAKDVAALRHSGSSGQFQLMYASALVFLCLSLVGAYFSIFYF